MMKHGHLMQRLEIFVQFLSLRSTYVTIVQSTRETDDINWKHEVAKQIARFHDFCFDFLF